MVVEDDIKMIGDRIYVVAKATLYDNETDDSISAQAMARESQTKKGMDDSQVTGATSSYARKYCLNGLFAIDDTKDADTNEHKKQSQAKDVQDSAEKIEAIEVLKDLYSQLSDNQKSKDMQKWINTANSHSLKSIEEGIEKLKNMLGME